MTVSFSQFMLILGLACGALIGIGVDELVREALAQRKVIADDTVTAEYELSLVTPEGEPRYRAVLRGGPRNARLWECFHDHTAVGGALDCGIKHFIGERMALVEAARAARP